MKVQFTKDAQKIVTVSEMPVVRKIISDFKNGDDNLNEYAEMAAALIAGCGCSVHVLESKAEIAKNCRVWNAYSDESCQLDIWITFTAVVNGMETIVVMCGVYLTDIWNIGDPEGNEAIKQHMYVRKFIEEK